MRTDALILMAAIACCSVHAQASDALSPPKGWHAPTPDDLRGEPLRNEHPTRYVEAKADFDGDGREDHAALFMADDGMSEGVFVKLSSVSGGTWTPVETVVHTRRSGAVMGIAVAKAASYKTTCGKGYEPCKKGEPAAIELKQPGIDFFKFESASSIIYWEASSRTFKRIWISD
jgi:hypothetical protein